MQGIWPILYAYFGRALEPGAAMQVQVSAALASSTPAWPCSDFATEVNKLTRLKSGPSSNGLRPTWARPGDSP